MISGAINPHVDFAVFLGNVPLSGVEGATISQLPPPSKICMQFLYSNNTWVTSATFLGGLSCISVHGGHQGGIL